MSFYKSQTPIKQREVPGAWKWKEISFFLASFSFVEIDQMPHLSSLFSVFACSTFLSIIGSGIWPDRSGQHPHTTIRPFLLHLPQHASRIFLRINWTNSLLCKINQFALLNLVSRSSPYFPLFNQRNTLNESYC